MENNDCYFLGDLSSLETCLTNVSIIKLLSSRTNAPSTVFILTNLRLRRRTSSLRTASLLALAAASTLSPSSSRLSISSTPPSYTIYKKVPAENVVGESRSSCAALGRGAGRREREEGGITRTGESINLNRELLHTTPPTAATLQD